MRRVAWPPTTWWPLRLRPQGATILCVLGMHRSGTSCLTGLLEDAGVFLGQVSKSNPFNKKGNQENYRIMALNDAILEFNGASWDNPPPGPLEFTPGHVAAIRELVAREYGIQKTWAFKDPRTLLTLEAWLAVIPDLHFIGTFRHPLAVAASLRQRQGWELERGLDLWYQYNSRLLGLHDRFDFPLLDFDLPFPVYAEKFLAALRPLGLRARPSDLAFYDAELMNNRAGDDTAALPPVVQAMHGELRSRAA